MGQVELNLAFGRSIETPVGEGEIMVDLEGAKTSRGSRVETNLMHLLSCVCSDLDMGTETSAKLNSTWLLAGQLKLQEVAMRSGRGCSCGGGGNVVVRRYAEVVVIVCLLKQGKVEQRHWPSCIRSLTLGRSN